MQPISSQINALDRSWVWIPDWNDCVSSQHNETAGRIVHFQRTFTLSAPNSESDAAKQPALIHLSADTRYKLFVNSVRAALGPARGTSSKWYYDTINIAPYLRPGENTLDVQVLRFYPNARGAAVPFPRCRYPGFTLHGGISGVDLGTGKEEERWRCRLDDRTLFNYGLRLGHLPECASWSSIKY